jgi:hypothetical protein
MGKLAAHFKGGFTIEYQKTLDWFELLEWEKVYRLQKTEEAVVYEYGHDSKGQPKKLPPYSTIREEVERRLEEHEKEIEEKIKNNV